MSRHATTGDGELTALHLLQRIAETGRTAAELKAVMTRMPQALINVKDVDKAKATIDRRVGDAIAALLQEKPVHAYRFRGTRFDCGTHLGLIEATISYALDNEKLSEQAALLMRNALDELGVRNLE